MDREILLEEALYDGDCDAVMEILQRPPDDIQIQFPTLLQAAASLGDVQMLEILLTHDAKYIRSDPDLFHWDRYLPCLNKCVEKNDSKMLKKLMDHLELYLTAEEFVNVEELFYISIRHGCSSSFLEILDPIWAKADPSRETTEGLIAFYGKALNCSQTEHDALFILYNAVTIGIKRHIGILVRGYQTSAHSRDDAEFQGLLNIVCRAQKSPDVAQAVSPLLVLMREDHVESVSQFKEWHAHLAKLSPKVTSMIHDDGRSADKSMGMQSPPFQQIQLLLDAMKRDPDDPETKEVWDSISEFMNELSLQLENHLDFLKFKPILVGSTNEGTRCFYPDEFDFLLLFENLDKHLSVDRLASDLIQCKFKNLEKEYQTQFESIRNGHYLSLIKLKKAFDEAMDSVIDQVHLKTDLKHGSLIIEKTGTFRQKSKFNCLFLTWKGDKYKDMMISIDLVPSFNLRHSPLPYHSFMPQEPRIYASMRGEVDYYLTTAFSEVENDIIKSLPEYIRCGYKIAKAFRNGALISPALPPQHHLVVRNIEDLLTSYMLKTCVFYMTQYLSDSSHKSTQPISWAIAIYKQLKEFIVDGFVPHFFLNSKKDLNDYCLFACDPEDRKDNHLCCQRRQALLAIIDRVLCIFAYLQPTDCLG